MTVRYDLYVVTDDTISRGRSHVQVAKEAVLGGADVIQLRDKNKTTRELLQVALAIRDITRPAGVTFIVNDRLDLALASRADGIHLGQDDLPVSLARKLSSPGFIIGVSVRSVHEAVTAYEDSADYVAVSPVYSTGTKPAAGDGLGTGLIREICQAIPIPVIGIGGIGLQNVREVIISGADGVAVVSAVVHAEDIPSAARTLKSSIEACKIERDPRVSKRPR